MRLFAEVTRRRTHRDGFGPLPLPSRLLEVLQAGAQRDGAQLRVLSDDASRFLLAGAVQVAEQTLRLDRSRVRELAGWVSAPGSGRADGVPPTAYPARPARTFPDFPGRDFAHGRGWGLPPSSTDPAARYPGVACLLTTIHDRPEDWVNAGQALQRILLTSAACGVAAALHTQPLELSWMTARHLILVQAREIGVMMPEEPAWPTLPIPAHQAKYLIATAAPAPGNPLSGVQPGRRTAARPVAPLAAGPGRSWRAEADGAPERQMLNALPHRHTHRGPFSPELLPGGLLADLQLIDRGRGYERLADPGGPLPAATAVLVTPGDDRGDWLCAGQALHRVLAQAAVSWVFASLHTQPLEDTQTRGLIRDRLALPGAPQMILQFGRARSTRVTARRPPSEVIDS